MANQLQQENVTIKKNRHFLERGPYITAKKSQQNASKDNIAKYVAEELVEDFDAVLLDAGSTAELIAQNLFTSRKFLTVMTNNMGAYVSYTQAVAKSEQSKIVQEQADAPQLVAGLLNENELILTGGRFDVTYEALFGDTTLASIQSFSPNVTIIGVSGLMYDDGAFCHGSEEVRLKRTLWKIKTDKRVIAADWRKIGNRDAFAFGENIAELKVGANRAIIVTNRPPENADAKLREQFDNEIELIKKQGIEVEQR